MNGTHVHVAQKGILRFGPLVCDPQRRGKPKTPLKFHSSCKFHVAAGRRPAVRHLGNRPAISRQKQRHHGITARVKPRAQQR